MITDSTQDFTDYTYPAIGTFLSIQEGIVIMYFRAIQYSLNSNDQEVLLRVFSSSEEEAIKTVTNAGYEIKEKWHFHEELDRLQAEVMQAAGMSAIVKENPNARSD
jgi:hydrogenase maturation factor